MGEWDDSSESFGDGLDMVSACFLSILAAIIRLSSTPAKDNECSIASISGTARVVLSYTSVVFVPLAVTKCYCINDGRRERLECKCHTREHKVRNIIE